MLSGLLGQDRQLWVPGPLLKFSSIQNTIHQLSRQETSNSVGGSKRVMCCNADDDVNVDDDVDVDDDGEDEDED